MTLHLMIDRVGWTLVHSLWIGAAAWMLHALIMTLISACEKVAPTPTSAKADPPQGHSNTTVFRPSLTRYWSSCFTLTLFALGVLAAFGFQLSKPIAQSPPKFAEKPPEVRTDQSTPKNRLVQPLDATPSEDLPTQPMPQLGPRPRAQSDQPEANASPTSSNPEKSPKNPNPENRLEKAFPWIVGAWCMGVGLMAFRQLAGWIGILRLKHRAQAANESLAQRVASLAKKLGVQKAVGVIESALARVPSAVGWLKPIIVLPAGLAMGLSPAHLDAILLHELSHIKRNDYLVNLIQTLIETLLFYHPATWVIGRRIRLEREHCCDDAVVAMGAGAVEYARSLLQVAEQSHYRGAMIGVAATGRKSELRGRIARLLGEKTGSSGYHWVIVVALGFLLSVVATMYTKGESPSTQRGTTPTLKDAEEILKGIKIPEGWRVEQKSGEVQPYHLVKGSGVVIEFVPEKLPYIKYVPWTMWLMTDDYSAEREVQGPGWIGTPVAGESRLWGTYKGWKVYIYEDEKMGWDGATADVNKALLAMGGKQAVHPATHPATQPAVARRAQDLIIILGDVKNPGAFSSDDPAKPKSLAQMIEMAGGIVGDEDQLGVTLIRSEDGVHETRKTYGVKELVGIGAPTAKNGDLLIVERLPKIVPAGEKAKDAKPMIYIMGGNRPGGYDFGEGMTVKKAFGMSGGDLKNIVEIVLYRGKGDQQTTVRMSARELMAGLVDDMQLKEGDVVSMRMPADMPMASEWKPVVEPVAQPAKPAEKPEEDIRVYDIQDLMYFREDKEQGLAEAIEEVKSIFDKPMNIRGLQGQLIVSANRNDHVFLRDYLERRRKSLTARVMRSSTSWFPAFENGKWGYIHTNGAWSIEPKYELAGYFSNDLDAGWIETSMNTGEPNVLAAVRIGGKFGYIDRAGKMIIEPQFKAASAFHDGLARVEDANGIGFIDRNGKMVLRVPKNKTWGDFQNQMAISMTRPWGAFPESEKFVPAMGFIDTSGAEGIAPRFEDAKDFYEELAAVKEEGKWGYINGLGKWVVKPKFEWANEFSEGLAAVKEEGKVCFINHIGRRMIEGDFEIAGYFSEGLCPVKINGKWGYINRLGNVVIEPKYEEANTFFANRSAVKVNGKFGYIDRTGKMIIEPVYANANIFAGYLARVTVEPARPDGTNAIYINRDGQVIWAPRAPATRPTTQAAAPAAKWSSATENTSEILKNTKVGLKFENMKLADALARLEESGSRKGIFEIYPNWRKLSTMGIDQETRVNVDLRNVQLGEALAGILKSISKPEATIAYRVHPLDGTVLISSAEEIGDGYYEATEVALKDVEAVINGVPNKNLEEMDMYEGWVKPIGLEAGVGVLFRNTMSSVKKGKQIASWPVLYWVMLEDYAGKDEPADPNNSRPAARKARKMGEWRGRPVYVFDPLSDDSWGDFAEVTERWIDQAFIVARDKHLRSLATRPAK